jgi:hypothetical protein
MRKAPTGQAAVLQLEAEAAAYGFRKIQDGQGKVRFVVTCTDCGREGSVFHAALRDERQLLAHFAKHGWMFVRREAQYCSTQCSRSAKEKQRIAREQRREDEMKHPLPPPAPVPAPAPAREPVASIGPDPKILRRVITLLNDHFDSEKRVYESGWSDERIAKEAAAALDFVLKYRVGAYGELAEDPEIGKLRDDLKAMDDLFTGQLKALEQNFAHQINEVRGRLERLGKVHHKASG